MAVQIAKIGRAVDGSGAVFQFTPAILSDLAETYNPESKHRAPFFEGHNERQRNKGLVTSLRVEGDRLWAESSDMDAEFALAVNKKRIPSLSPALYHPDSDKNPTPGRWYLRHVAGVQIPGIKGLAAPEFSETEGGIVYVFSEPQDQLVGLVWRLRQLLLDRFDPETADLYIPQTLLEDFQLMAADSTGAAFEEGSPPSEPEAAPATAIADPPPADAPTPADLDARAAELEAQASTLQAEKAKLDARAAELDAQENTEFMEKQIKQGFPPALRDLGLSLLGSADNATVLVFGEGNDERLTQKGQVQQLMSHVRIPVAFGEVSGDAAPEGDRSPAALAAAAQKLIDESNGRLTVSEAMNQLGA